MKNAYEIFYLKKTLRLSYSHIPLFPLFSVENRVRRPQEIQVAKGKKQKTKSTKAQQHLLQKNLFLKKFKNKFQSQKNKNSSQMNLYSKMKTLFNSSNFYKKNQTIQKNISKNLRKLAIFFFMFIKKSFSVKQMSPFSLIRKIFLDQTVSVYQMYCILFLENLKNGNTFFHFFYNFIFFKFISTFFVHTKQTILVSKIEMNKLIKVFFEKKRKIAQFFFNVFLNIHDGSIKNGTKKFVSNMISEKYKFFFIQFFLEILVSLFSRFKNFKNFQEKNNVLQICTKYLKKKFFCKQKNLLRWQQPKRTRNKENFFALMKKKYKHTKKIFFIISKKKIYRKIYNFLFLKIDNNFAFETNSAKVFFLNKKYQKNLFLNSFKLVKKTIQIFLEYSFPFNFLKMHIDSTEDWNNFIMVFHQHLKFPEASFQAQIQQNRNCFFQYFSSLYVLNKHLSSFYKKSFTFCSQIDEIHLIPEFQKTNSEINQEKMKNLFQKNLSSFQTSEKIKPCLFGKKQVPTKLNLFLPLEKKIFSLHYYVALMYLHLEKSLFHFFRRRQSIQIKKQFFTQNDWFNQETFSYFNFFSFCSKIFKKFFINPIFLIFINYSSNFLFFNSRLIVFLKDKNSFKKIGNSFENLIRKEEYFFSNGTVKNIIQGKKKEFVENSLGVHLSKAFDVLRFQRPKKTQILVKFINISWLFSKKFFFLPTKVSSVRFFHFFPIFSTFLGMNSPSLLPSKQKMLRFLSEKKNCRSLNFDKFSFSLSFTYEKQMKKLFIFQKKPTRENINFHLKNCKQILKNSIGQKQLDFMQKLHKKIILWCKKYKTSSTKEIFYYCDSMVFKFLWAWAKKTHPNKSKVWIRKKYFHLMNSNKWFFGKKKGKNFICLPLHSQTKIQK